MAGTKIQVVLDDQLLAALDQMVAEADHEYANRAWAVRLCVRRETARQWDRRALEAVSTAPAPTE